MKNLLSAVILIAGLIAAYLAGQRSRSPEILVCQRTDTVRIVCPEVTAIYIRGESVERLPIASDTAARTDSADVIVPVSQAVYTGEDYTAYVSGFRPSLDSIFITRDRYTSIGTSCKTPSRWSIGIQAGYGITPRGFQPFIGIGVSFRIL